MAFNDIPAARLRERFAAFLPNAEFISAEECYGGHINRTFFVDARVYGEKRRFVLQSVNKNVFKNYAGVMDNVFRISAHLGSKSLDMGSDDPTRDHIHFIRAADGGLGVDGEVGYWRLYRYIDRAEGRLSAKTPAEARAAAAAFGRFQWLLADLPSPRLWETISAFHDTRQRFANLEKSAEFDAVGRRAAVKDDIEGFLSLKSEALKLQEAFERGEIPERIAHNDAKYSNVLMDVATNRAVCVIDLDTCMPGLSLHDFGDLMRSMSCDRPEDEPDTSKIVVRRDMYDALLDGFLSQADNFLVPAERSLLPNSGVVITLETGSRFLADYLDGDHYFHIDYPEHNLVRARSQLALARSMLDTLM
ncbi:MAG: phosphotransferase [Kiritimatiellae bacterium]|nr:phosphotransferase [Kiritimatiellia bacterium]